METIFPWTGVKELVSGRFKCIAFIIHFISIIIKLYYYIDCGHCRKTLLYKDRMLEIESHFLVLLWQSQGIPLYFNPQIYGDLKFS